MAKKKNTKSARALPDILAAALCLAGAALCLAYFWLDLNRSLERYSEQPLGTVSWKRRAAQRRFANRVLWDRLRQDSPVYSGDYIRTEELSAAAISFASGSLVNIGENSLIQIFREGEAPRVRLNEGSLRARAREADLLIASGDNNVRVKPGGLVSARAENEVLRVKVEEGGARVSSAGDAREAAAGEGFSLSGAALESSSAEISVSAAPQAPVLLPPVLFTPGEGGVIRYQGGLPRVRFRWNAVEGEGLLPSYYILEASDSPGLENPALSLQSRENGAWVSLPAPGLWYWRVRPVYSDGRQAPASPVGSFRVEEGPVPDAPVLFAPPLEDASLRTIFPPDGYVVAEALLPDLRFTWKAPAGEAQFQVSSREDFAGPEVDEGVSGTAR
ncbi:MAG: FecR family protein, partial [Spirochaetia bacterium]|nr:FecR family protein [Spirochaetia bacterium]